MATNQDNTAANKTPPPRAKKGGGWFWLLLVIVIAAGGGGAYLANTPIAQQIAAKLGWQVIAYSKAQPAPPIDKAPIDEEMTTPPQVAVLPPDLHAPAAPYAPANADNADNVDNIGSFDIDNAAGIDNTDNADDIRAQLASINRRLDLNDNNNEKRWRQLQSRLHLLEQRAANNADGNDGQQSIQLIDINLRASGNASAAAAALESIAESAASEEQKAFILSEARRLKAAPDREHITAAINELRALLRDIGDIPAGGKPQNAALSMVFSLLKVQKITTAKTRAEGLDDALAKMEWLLVVGRDTEYLRELDTAAARWQSAKDENDDDGIALLFDKLRRMGAPRYHLGAGVQ